MPTYNTRLDPISPDFDPKSWLDPEQRICTEPDGQKWIEEVQMYAHDILIQECAYCSYCGKEV